MMELQRSKFTRVSSKYPSMKCIKDLDWHNFFENAKYSVFGQLFSSISAKYFFSSQKSYKFFAFFELFSIIVYAGLRYGMKWLKIHSLIYITIKFDSSHSFGALFYGKTSQYFVFLRFLKMFKNFKSSISL